MPRFVILQHDHPETHWDLMLEAGPVLRTWQLGAPLAPGCTVPAQSSFDHRLLYLDYEGPISGNRGSVVQWDRGEFDWLKQEENEVSVLLHGMRLQGVLLVRPAGGNGFAQFEPASP